MDRIVAELSELGASFGVEEEVEERVSEPGGAVGQDDALSDEIAETFRTERRRDDWSPHGQSLEDLQSRPAARAQRRNCDARVGEMRRHVWDTAGDLDAGPFQATDLGAGISSDESQGGGRQATANERPDVAR